MRKIVDSFFNDGNYFLHRDSFIQCIKPFWEYSALATDVMFANYLWLYSNNTLKVLRNSRYIHRIHARSTWLNNSEKSKSVNESIKKRFQAKLSPYSECMNQELLKKSKKWVEPTLIPLCEK